MKNIISQRLLLVMVLVLTSQVSYLAVPVASTKSFDFDVSSIFGDRDKFDFAVTESGCILAQIKSWSRSGLSASTARQLALVLNGSDQIGSYARTDGTASSVLPLWVSYAVTSTQASRALTWTISVVNFDKSGTAKGTLNLEFPPTKMPCELNVAPSRVKGQIDSSWRYTGKAFKGSFLIERSTDASQWSVLCTKPAPNSSNTLTNYSCPDTKLISGTTYYYRACAITYGSKCGATDLTPAMGAKAP